MPHRIQCGLLVVPLVVTAQLLLLVALAAESGLATSALVASSALLALSVAIGAAVAAASCAHWSAREALELIGRPGLDARVDLAEKALAHSKERIRIHELRSQLRRRADDITEVAHIPLDNAALHVARRRAEDLTGDLWLEPPRPAGGAEFALRLSAATGQVPWLAPAA